MKKSTTGVNSSGCAFYLPYSGRQDSDAKVPGRDRTLLMKFEQVDRL
jgi:hypothetical protein